MSYDLSFSPEFFLAEGEPYDVDTFPSERPKSVWQAIISMPPDAWAALARDYYDVEPHFLSAETVLDSVIATNTCSNLNTPVEVWIDPQGYYTVKVW